LTSVQLMLDVVLSVLI